MHSGSPRDQGSDGVRRASCWPPRRWVGLVATVAAFSVFVVGTGLVAADSIEGNPALEAQIPDNQSTAGEDGRLELEITNDGDVVTDETRPVTAEQRVTETRAVRVKATDTDGTSFEANTNQHSLVDQGGDGVV